MFGLGISFALAGLFSNGQAHAQERPLRSAPPRPVTKPKTIENAIGLYLTIKGEAYVGTSLETIFASNGVSLREGYFPQIRYQSEKPIPLEEVASSSPEAAKLVKNVRKLLAEWFIGLRIQNPQPDVLVSNGGYRLSFRRLQMSVDREALRRLGRSTGIVVALEAEVDRLEVGGEAIAVRDPRNQFVGSLGVLSPVLSLAPGSKALRLRVPLYVDIGSDGVRVESLAAETNFAETSLQFAYGSLIVPDISVEINGTKFPLDKSRLVQTFEEMKPRLLASIKGMADKIVSQSMSNTANEAIKKSLPQKIEQVNRLPAPGAPEGSKDPDFTWGLALKQVGAGSQVLGVTMNGYVEDPLRPETALVPALNARGPVSLAGADPARFDLALAINRGLFNRILQLSCQRGYFNEVESKPGQKLKLFSCPVIDADPSSAGRDVAEPKIRIRVGIASAVSGIKRTLIKGEVRFSVDLVGRLVRMPGERYLRVQLDEIDGSSLDLVEDTLTALGRSFLRPLIVAGIQSELQSASSAWRAKPLLIPGDLPLPPELMGQSFKTLSMRMDRNGYLVMFLDFEKKNGGHEE